MVIQAQHGPPRGWSLSLGSVPTHERAILGESFPRIPSHSVSQIPTTNETTLGKPKSHLTSFLMKACKQIQESSYFARVNIGPGEQTAPGNTVDSQAHCGVTHLASAKRPFFKAL